MHASLMVSQSRCSLLEEDSKTRKFLQSWSSSSNRSVYRLSSFHRLTAIWTENFKPGLVLKPATNKNMYFDAHAVVKPPKSISVDLLRLPSAASSASVIGFESSRLGQVHICFVSTTVAGVRRPHWLAVRILPERKRLRQSDRTAVPVLGQNFSRTSCRH